MRQKMPSLLVVAQAEVGLLLRDAAAHEEAAVAAAITAERAACAQVFGTYMQCSPVVAATLADTVRQVHESIQRDQLLIVGYADDPALTTSTAGMVRPHLPVLG